MYVCEYVPVSFTYLLTLMLGLELVRLQRSHQEHQLLPYLWLFALGSSPHSPPRRREMRRRIRLLHWEVLNLI